METPDAAQELRNRIPFDTDERDTPHIERARPIRGADLCLQFIEYALDIIARHV